MGQNPIAALKLVMTVSACMGLAEKIGGVYDTDVVCQVLYRANRRFPGRTLSFMPRCAQSGMKIYKNYYTQEEGLSRALSFLLSIFPAPFLGKSFIKKTFFGILK